MVKTNLIPWQHEAIVLTILTQRELTREEQLKVCQAYSKGRPPSGPYKALTELVEELKSEGLYELANLIIFPS